MSGNGLRSERTGGIPVRECGPFGAVGLHLPSPKLRSASRKENKPRPHVGGATERGSSLPGAARLGPSGGSLPEAVQAVDRPRTVGLEGHLGLFAAVCANDVVHLPRPAVEPSAAAASVSVSIHCSNSLFAGPSRDRRPRNKARPIRRRVHSRGRAMPSNPEKLRVSQRRRVSGQVKPQGAIGIMALAVHLEALPSGVTGTLVIVATI